MKDCTSGKKMYATSTLAEDALISAQVRFDFDNRQGPIAIYQCADCNQYHLTSRGPANARLIREQNDGTIRLKRAADRWQDKLGNSR